jgi:hypothetical protein
MAKKFKSTDVIAGKKMAEPDKETTKLKLTTKQ